MRKVRRQDGTPRRKFCRDGHDNSGPEGGQQPEYPVLTVGFVIPGPWIPVVRRRRSCGQRTGPSHL